LAPFGPTPLVNRSSEAYRAHRGKNKRTPKTATVNRKLAWLKNPSLGWDEADGKEGLFSCAVDTVRGANA